MRTLRLATWLLAALLAASPVLAQQQGPPPATDPPSGGDAGNPPDPAPANDAGGFGDNTLLWVLLALVLIVGVIALVAFAANRGPPPADRYVEVREERRYPPGSSP